MCPPPDTAIGSLRTTTAERGATCCRSNKRSPESRLWVGACAHPLKKYATQAFLPLLAEYRGFPDPGMADPGPGVGGLQDSSSVLFLDQQKGRKRTSHWKEAAEVSQGFFAISVMGGVRR